MGVMPCTKCGTTVNTEATACPECGSDPRTGELVNKARPGIAANLVAEAVEPEIDPASGDVALRTVSGAAFSLPIDVFGLLREHAPLVAAKVAESPTRDWGWPQTRLAAIDPNAVLLHAVQCYHGEGNRGWLVATLDQLWWLKKSRTRTEEKPLHYDWIVEVETFNRLAIAFMSGPGELLGAGGRGGCLRIGGDQFQMRSNEVEEFSRFLRQMQDALAYLDSSEAPAAPPAQPAVQPVVVQNSTPGQHLKELAELRDAGVISEEEFQAKKTEILNREW